MMLSWKKEFSIAGIQLVLEREQPLRMNNAFWNFGNPESGNKAPYRVIFQEVQELYIPNKAPEYEQARFAVIHPEDNTYYRIFKKSAGNKLPYAVSRYHKDNKEILVEYLHEERAEIETVQQAFLYVPWEWILMCEKKLMLHASCVETPFGGLVFAGASGIGKSTQGDLWCRYGNGKLINGDKTILSRDDGNWYGHGSPYAGSSKCYVNERCRLNGIFFLKQGACCQLKVLSAPEAFKRIYSELTINRWDLFYVETVSMLDAELVRELPVYEFTCTPDENAVRFLEKKLREGESSRG